ncbi:DNA-binding protein [Mesorhizobium sp. 43Arga]
MASWVTKPRRELDTGAVCRRYRISDTTLDRRLDDRRSGFPQPHWRGRRRFWLESELDAFDTARIKALTGDVASHERRELAL